MINTQGISNLSIFGMVRQDIARAQKDLARIQLQLSSQRRLLTPHDDVGATGRVLRLQNILEQQTTFRSTIGQARSKLEQSDGVLSEMNSQLIELQALVVDMSDSGATPAMRQATAETVNQNLHALVDLANTQVADQFLFSGFDSGQTPFVREGTEVIFHGDANEILAQISQGQYLGTTLDPAQAFGSLSVEKQGTANLNPRLNLGQGHIDGHQVTAAGTTTTLTDSTLIGQTASDLIGREVWVSAGTNAGEHGTISGFNTATGEITIAAADAFNAAFDTTSVFSVSEGRPGTRLADLNGGTGVQAGTIRITTTEFTTGTTVDLSTARTITDVKERIENLSSRLQVSINAGGNGLTVTDTNGTSITIASVDGVTTAEDLGINGTNAGGTITGSDVNPRLTERTLTADLAGAVNDPIVLNSIYVTNGNRSGSIDLSSATTIEDLLDTINNATASDGRDFHLQASINSAGTGINVLSRISGADFSISRNAAGDATAEDLGLLTMTGSTTVSSLRGGLGLDTAAGTDFVIDVSGTQHNIDLSSAQTLQDIINAVNTQTGGAVTASINDVQGNRLELTAGASMFLAMGQSNAAEQLGFQLGQNGATQQGTDVAALRVDSLFTATADFYTSLMNNDQSGIIQSGIQLDDAFDTLLQGRAKVGGRLTRLDLTLNRLDNEEVFVNSDLSNTLDIDLTEAISDLQAQQVALQATYATSAQMLQLSLVNFL